MAAPSGTEREIYKSPYKTAGKVRVKIRLDRPVASTNFVDEFGDASFDTTLWSSWTPPNTSITEAGGNLTLASTASTNGFPVVQSVPGKTFPLDLSIGWTLEWTQTFSVIAGYGSMFRVCDIKNSEAIVAISANTADGMAVEMPDGTELENLGADTDSHDFELIYTPPTGATAGQYELKRDTVSKGTIASTDRPAWYIMMGNGSVQVGMGNWSTLVVARVDVNLVSNESTDYPDWTDLETSGTEIWGRLPWVDNMSISTHKRNDLDQAVMTLSQSGFVTGIEGDINGKGYRSNMFKGFTWANKEVRIESQQSDGTRGTSWKEIFRGLCDEPVITSESGSTMLSITVREKNRRRLQMSHLVRGYSDNGTAIDGVLMNKTTEEIIEDICGTCGLASGDHNVVTLAHTPRSWQILGTSALSSVLELADHAAAAVYRNCDQTNDGRIEVQEWDFGSKTPDFYLGIDEDIIALDWAETALGAAAQVVLTVQHSEFGEFSDVYPFAPVPSFGGIIRKNIAIVQTAAKLSDTRDLKFLSWKVANRELSSIVVSVIGQDWIEHNLECQVLDHRALGLARDEYYIVDGWEYQWDPSNGWRTNIHLVNQEPEKAIMRNKLDQTVAVVYA